MCNNKLVPGKFSYFAVIFLHVLLCILSGIVSWYESVVVLSQLLEFMEKNIYFASFCYALPIMHQLQCIVLLWVVAFF